MAKNRVLHPELKPLLEAHGVSAEVFWKKGPASVEVRAARRAIVTEFHRRGFTYKEIKVRTGLSQPSKHSDLTGSDFARENQRRVGRTIGKKNLAKGQERVSMLSLVEREREAKQFGFDPKRQMLGSLCSKGHDHGGSGRSLRWLKKRGGREAPGDCFACRMENRALRYSMSREKAQEDSKRWYWANVDRAKESQRRYAKTHAEELRAARSKWRAENAEVIREKKRRYYLANAERLKRKQSLYYRRHHAQELFKRALWRLANPEKRKRQYCKWARSERGRECRRRITILYHGLRKEQLGTVTLEYKQAWLEAFNYKCPVCQHDLDTSGAHHAKSLTWDHVIPISRGGIDADSNLLPLCQSCNSRKGSRTFEEWLGSPLNSYRDLRRLSFSL